MSYDNIFFTRRPIATHDIKKTHNGVIESYGDFATDSRRQINNLAVNGTDIPALIHSHVAGVVGQSVNIQGANEDKTINNQFEKLLKKHGKMRNFSKTGRYSRNESFRLAEAFKVQHGGVLIRYHYGYVPGADIPFTVDLIGVDRIDLSKNNRTVKNGLEKNRHGRITHIWLHNEDKTSSSRYSMKNIHFYSKIWIDLSQYTAVSQLVTILSTIEKTGRYFDAELENVIEKARAGVYWGTELYDLIVDLFNKNISSMNLSQKDQLEEVKKIMSSISLTGAKPIGLTPIPKDDKIWEQSSNADSVIDTFAGQSQKSISSAMGGSSVSVFKDVSIGNYASIKAAISFDEEAYKIDFSSLCDNYIDDYLERLFMVGVQTGAINISREEYFNDRDEYHKWDILRVSKRSVDEKVSASARKMDAEADMTTKVREYAEKGQDYREEARKQALADVDVALMRKELFEQNGVQDPNIKVEN